MYRYVVCQQMHGESSLQWWLHFRWKSNESNWQWGSTLSLSGTVQRKIMSVSSNDNGLFEETNEQHIFSHTSS